MYLLVISLPVFIFRFYHSSAIMYPQVFIHLLIIHSLFMHIFIYLFMTMHLLFNNICVGNNTSNGSIILPLTLAATLALIIHESHLQFYVLVHVFYDKNQIAALLAESCSSLHHTYSSCTHGCSFYHDDVIKWKHFPRYWPFARSPVNSPHKGQWRGALMFSLICVRINGWVNNREAGDLRCYRAHYDGIVTHDW